MKIQSNPLNKYRATEGREFNAGLITPFVKMDGLYFDGSPEPNNFYYDLIMREKRRAKKHGQTFVMPNVHDQEEFYDALYEMEKYTNENAKMYETSKEGEYEIFVHDEVDIDDRNGPSIEADAKKKSKKEKEEILKKKLEKGII